MSRLKTIRGVLDTFWQLTKEEWYVMDHKLMRIATGVVGFVIAVLFWYFFFRNMSIF